MLASTASGRVIRRVAGGICGHAPVAAAVARLGRAANQGIMRTVSSEAYDQGSSDYQPDAAAAGPTVFVSFDVYKGKGAMNIKPIPATWEQTEKGGFRLQREGVFYVEMANGSNRTYDWSKKVGIALSCLEVANILAEPNREHNMYHDPNKGRAGEGQVRKTFKWTPKDDVYLLSSSVSDRNNPSADSYANCSMTLGEFYLFRQIANNAFWYLTGWDQKFLPPAQQ
eukprot:GHUV01003169.1.p1 GENE.GHUV01003169.1~~GHUV01003169.1.p1  ORF type:complete len:226 (+),score=71.75 GHUV01003169.1:359-1036(+)